MEFLEHFIDATEIKNVKLVSFHDRLFCPISHATLWAWFNITILLANLLTKPSVFLLLRQLYIL